MNNSDKENNNKEFKLCPFCAEDIISTAKKCKHCGEILDPVLRKKNENTAPSVINNISTSASVSQKGEKYRRGFPHFLNLILTIITGGAWLIIWILWYVFRSDKYR